MSESLIAVLIVFALLAALWIRWSILERDVWAIGIYAGADPLRLAPHPGLVRQPVLCANDVTDVRAEFVADPFVARAGGTWHLFFEALNHASRRGEIALASSPDGLRWQYEGIVLSEPFHLSYPYVFVWEGNWYMIPESRRAHAVRLYRADSFPTGWNFAGELLRGEYSDASILRRDGLWWLFAADAADDLTLHYASDLRGPWLPHESSPVVRSDSRPGGRVTLWDARIIRYAQRGVPTYGSAVHAFEIDELTPTRYREHAIADAPVLAASGQGWNAHGMHHIDPCPNADGTWIAYVDGKRRRKVFRWRKGAARLLQVAGVRRRVVARDQA